MNNYERIKNMSIDEMVEFLNNADCDWCIYADREICNIDNQDLDDCYNGIKQWLESEVSDDRD